MILECVVNVSEGRDLTVTERIAAAADGCILDTHSDRDHHRSVLTLAEAPQLLEHAVRDVARRAVAEIDLRTQRGVHPRLGSLDVVPFVCLAYEKDTLRDADSAPARLARDDFAKWCAHELRVPCFLYGTFADGRVRTLPEIRRRAFTTLAPDWGPAQPHPTAGAVAVGARPLLVAYNLFLAGGDVGLARAVAAELRGPTVRALGLEVAGRPQVSCNLVDPWRTGPAAAYDRVAALLAAAPGAVTIERAELVGLVPAGVLASIPPERYDQLDVGPDRTIEARLSLAGLRPEVRSPD